MDIVGTAHLITDPADFERATALDLPTWLDPGLDGGFVRILATVVTGRWVTPKPAGG